MTSGPLPPHERPWRHPSELAGPAPEPTTRTGRLLILSTATISLLLVGVLALALAPRRADRSDAFVASTLLVVTAPLAGAVAAESASPATAPPPTATPPTAAPTTTAAPVTVPTTLQRGFRPGMSGYGAAVVAGWTGPAVVTPLGGSLAVTTASALDDGEVIDAVVPSGEEVRVEMIASSAGLAFVIIVEGAPAHTMAVAPIAHPDDSIYLSLGETTVPIEPATLATADVPEGAPLVNADGALVGLCTYGSDGVEVVPIGTVPDVSGP